MNIHARQAATLVNAVKANVLLVKLMFVNSPGSIFPVLAKKDTVKCKL